MSEEFEGKIPAYSASIDKKTKGEVTFHLSVHLDDLEEVKKAVIDMKGFLLSEAQDLEAKLMKGDGYFRSA